MSLKFSCRLWFSYRTRRSLPENSSRCWTASSADVSQRFVPNSLLFDFYSAQIILHTILWEHKRPAGLFLISERLLGHRGSQYSQPRNSSGRAGPGRANCSTIPSLCTLCYGGAEVQITTVKRTNNKQENINANNMTGTTLTTHNRTTGQQIHQSNVRYQNTTTQMFFDLMLSFCDLHIRATRVRSTMSLILSMFYQSNDGD